MTCNKCQTQSAAIQLFFLHQQLNRRLDLCFACYEEFQSLPKSADSPFRETKVLFLTPDPPKPAPPKPNSSLLDKLARNLSHLARSGELDPVTGRDAPIREVVEILHRRTKNNPVLIGEPGVGKTAIAEGLALFLAGNAAPFRLRGKNVYVLDVASLVSGTSLRGQFEDRMQKLIEEVQQRSDVILFIDEIHQLVGAGSPDGSMDAGNLLKPALARGTFQLIGATTLSEYRLIEKDAALARRFQPVRIQEPSEADTLLILQSLRPTYEAYHGVQFSNEVLTRCVSLSARYMPDRFFPDKAIDLLDTLGAHLSVSSPEREEKRRQLAFQLAFAQTSKEKATLEERYEEAALFRRHEEELRRQMTRLQPAALSEDVELLVEQRTGIPVRRMGNAHRTAAARLEDILGQRVIGQPEAVQRVAQAIKRHWAGLQPPERPAASFLFSGPTGVGKTALARAAAAELFGSHTALIRLDMSEFREPHSVSKLIGAPPGYKGFEDGGQLTEKVRRQPHCLLLLDELEKAHPDVLHVFLQLLEDGRLTDSQGRTVDFRHTFIIATTNAGVSLKSSASLGFSAADDSAPPAAAQLLGHFSPELINRFDQVISFAPLSSAALLAIADQMLADLSDRLLTQHVTLDVSAEARETLARLGHDPAFGARPLRRALQTYVENPLADLLLHRPGLSRAVLSAENGQLTLTPAAPSAPCQTAALSL